MWCTVRTAAIRRRPALAWPRPPAPPHLAACMRACTPQVGPLVAYYMQPGGSAAAQQPLSALLKASLGVDVLAVAGQARSAEARYVGKLRARYSLGPVVSGAAGGRGARPGVGGRWPALHACMYLGGVDGYPLPPLLPFSHTRTFVRAWVPQPPGWLAPDAVDGLKESPAPCSVHLHTQPHTAGAMLRQATVAALCLSPPAALQRGVATAYRPPGHRPPNVWAALLM